MKVSTDKPFQIIYSLYQHQYLGYLFESFVIQLNARGELTYANQNVSSKNIKEFSKGIDEVDVELVKLMDAIQQDTILKKFNPKHLKAYDYFSRYYKEKPDLALQAAIEEHLNNYRAKILPKLIGKRCFIMGNDDPTKTEIKVTGEKTKVYMNFDRKEDHTVYFPVLRCAGEKVKLQFAGAQMLSDSPAFLLSNNTLYHFDSFVNGKKLRPFFDKNNIKIDRRIERTYFNNFVKSLVAQFNVFSHSDGILIKKERPEKSPTPSLNITEIVGVQSQLSKKKNEQINLDKLRLELNFIYGNDSFQFESKSAANVSLEEDKENDRWIFHKKFRDLAFERSIIEKLFEFEQDFSVGKVMLGKYEGLSWLQLHAEAIKNAGIEVTQSDEAEKKYFVGTSSLEVSIEENNDWFDIKTKVRFGAFEVAFIKLRELVLANIREFRLPDGQIAIIPEEWFIRYHELFMLSDLGDEEGQVILQKHHFQLVNNLDKGGLANSVINRRLLSLQSFEEIKSYDVPKEFKGELRPYQKAGYDWLNFLRDYNLGGCLADDMGLGKTVMTLAYLQNLKNAGVKNPTLLVMPTSLIYNWQKEAERFTPGLKLLLHTGSNRVKSTGHFGDYDLVLTSYGVLRRDIKLVQKFRFECVILDESQAIKNPTAAITKAVRNMNCKNRLILTGTPLENSTMDLWSQMTFVNPGLLGSQKYFKENYQLPIEKKHDEAATKRLYAKIKPFMLRRQKSQVATELPEKIESVQYCDMSESQEKKYEETKAYYRNMILDHIKEKGINKSQLVVLQGLSKLRQIANNPLMVDPDYEGDSGKDADVIHKLKSIIEGGSKVLVFSQFVKHLTIIRNYLDENEIAYAYLDGGTKNRAKQVDDFQENPELKVFLISLKAGGVGLNLTAAEYVFLLDPWWNPAIEAQAVDRAHRIGQKNTVFTYKFISRNTLEEKILTLQNRKKRLFDELITTEETFTKSLSQDDILSLLD